MRPASLAGASRTFSEASKDGKDIEHQIYGGVENGLGTTDYVIEKVILDRSQKAISRFYPEVRAKKIKPMYSKNLKGDILEKI